MVFPNESKFYLFVPSLVKTFEDLKPRDQIYLNSFTTLLAANAHQMYEFPNINEVMLRKFLHRANLGLVGRTLSKKSEYAYNCRIIIPGWEKMPLKSNGRFLLSFILRRTN